MPDIVQGFSIAKISTFIVQERFLPFHPNVVSLCLLWTFTTALFRSYHRKIISHSDGHSLFNRQTKKPIHRHQKSAGALLSLQNDVLCIGFEIQRRDCLFIRSLADSTKKHKVWTAVFSLSTPQALGGFAAFFSIKTSCIQL